MGSAEKENEAYLDSWSAKLNQTKALLSELVLGDGGLESFGKKILGLGIKILEFANSDLGQVIIKTTAFTVAVTTGMGVLSNFSTLVENTVKTAIVAYIAAIGQGATATETFNAVLTALNINPVILGITTFVAGLYGLYKISEMLNPSLESLNKKVQEANSEYDTVKQNLDSLQTALETVQKQIEAINNQDNISVTDEKQLTLLHEQEASLERQIVLQQQLQEEAQSEATKAGKKVLGKQVTDEVFGVDIGSGEVQSGTTVEALDAYIQKINDLQTQIEGLITERQKLIDSGQKESDAYNDLNAQITDLVDKQNVAKEKGAEYAQSISDATENANQNDETIKNAIDSWDNYTEALKNSGEAIDDVKEASSYVGDEIDDENDSIDEQTSGVQSLEEAWKSWNSAIDDVQSAYKTLSEAVSEYNTQGGYSIDTLQSLLALDPSYLSALQEQNGQMTLNTQVLKDKIQAQADEAKQIIYNTAIEKLNAIASGEAGQAASDAATDHNNAVTGINNETNALLKNTQAQYSNAITKARAQGGSGAREQIDQVIKETQQQLKLVDSMVNSVGVSFDKSMGGTATKATNKATNAVNKQTQALQNAKKALESKRDAKVKDVENQLKALEKEYNANKKTLEDQRDVEIQSIEDRIDVIEDQRDVEIQSIEDQIDAIEKERDARKKYWEEQLDNLEAQNQAVEDGIELQQKLSDLATAQQTQKMVFKNGRFVYASDESAVSGAQEALDEFNRQKEYERQKSYLESLRDAEDENYEQRLDDLNDFKDKRKDYYDKLLDDLNDFKDKSKDYYDKLLDDLKDHYDEEKQSLEDYKDYLKDYYEDRINALENQKNALNNQYNGMLNNQKNYQNTSLSSQRVFYATSLAEAQAYVNQYDAIMRGASSGIIAVTSKSEYIKVNGKTTSTTIGEALAGGAARRRSNAKSTGDNYVKGYASGVSSIGDDSISVVGENPKYRELVIGSKLNNDQGVLMSLKRGSGVVNAGVTNTLASIFNALTGQRSVGQAINNNSNQSTKIEIGNISLPEVKDGQGFISYLQNFTADLTQRAFKR